MSVSAWRTRSAPKIGRPCPHSIISAPQPAISRSAAAQSLAKRCTFCGLPAFGTAQMNRSPGWRTPQLGHQRPRGVVGLAAGVVQLERQPALGERQVVAVGDVGVAVRRPASAKRVDGEANWRWLIAVFQPSVRS